MDEDIGPYAGIDDEAKPFFLVKPLYGAFGHGDTLVLHNILVLFVTATKAAQMRVFVKAD